MSMPAPLTLLRPDDWHVHLRDGPMMKAVLPATARNFGRAIVMPNLADPVTTTAKALAYRERIQAALAPSDRFTPLMTLYLTDTTLPDDVERGFSEGILTAAKLYPANATTNAAHGVTDIQSIAPVFERMQKLGMVLSIHGEVADPDIDIFDREAVFIDRMLIPLRRHFPALKIVLEHVTTRKGVDYVFTEGRYGPLAATVTPHHLHLNRNAIFAGGLRPHAYCLPVAKREEDRQALIAAATSGAPMFFLGTDSAPHAKQLKEMDGGRAGIFNASSALSLYAAIFDEENALDRLEAFASRNGAAFYGLPQATKTITLHKTEEPLSFKPILTEDGAEIVPFGLSNLKVWRVA